MAFKSSVLYHRKHARRGGSFFSSLVNFGKKLIPKVLNIGRKVLPTVTKGIDYYNKNKDQVKNIIHTATQLVPDKYRGKVRGATNFVTERLDDHNDQIQKGLKIADEFLKKHPDKSKQLVKAPQPTAAGYRRGGSYGIDEPLRGGAVPENVYLNTIKAQKAFDNQVRGKPKAAARNLTTKEKILRLVKG